MWLARISLTAVVGFGFSAGLFWVLAHLVGAEFDVNQLPEATRIDFTHMRRDTETVTKRDVRVERAEIAANGGEPRIDRPQDPGGDREGPEPVHELFDERPCTRHETHTGIICLEETQRSVPGRCERRGGR